MLFEDGVQKLEKLPEEIERKFVRAGILEPFCCEKMEEYRQCGK